MDFATHDVKQDTSTGMDTDVIEQLIRLQDLDRARDRLQRKLDQIPIRLKGHADAIAALEQALEAQEGVLKAARAEADRAELEAKTREERRERIKQLMNAPQISNREYQVLQTELAGVLADINVFSDQAIKALDRAGEADAQCKDLRGQSETARKEMEEARAKLEASVADVRAELEQRDAERKEFVATIEADALHKYERVRAKHSDALSRVEGTIDRAAGRLGTDVHCSACYMTVTPNDAVRVIGRKEVVQCRSCVRILYVR